MTNESAGCIKIVVRRIDMIVPMLFGRRFNNRQKPIPLKGFVYKRVLYTRQRSFNLGTVYLPLRSEENIKTLE